MEQRKISDYTMIYNSIIRTDKLDTYQKSCINNILSNEENFKLSLNNLSKRIPCSQRKLQQIINTLKELDIISVEKIRSVNGDWDCNRYLINIDNLFKHIGVENNMPNVENNMPNGREYNAEQVENNMPTKNTNKNTNKENIYKDIINYLNEKSNKKYRSNTPKTKALINTRLKEGFTEEDFYKVIDIKTIEWKNTDFENYLRPETLFGNKFEGYLNTELKTKVKQKKSKNYFEA